MTDNKIFARITIASHLISPDAITARLAIEPTRSWGIKEWDTPDHKAWGKNNVWIYQIGPTPAVHAGNVLDHLVERLSDKQSELVEFSEQAFIEVGIIVYQYDTPVSINLSTTSVEFIGKIGSSIDVDYCVRTMPDIASGGDIT